MSNNSKNANVKDAKKSFKNENLSKINLDKLAKNLKERVVNEKMQKSLLYIYPENISKVEINGQLGKKHRSKMRRLLQNFADIIYISVKQKDALKLIAEIKKFDAFYKENFFVNDYSLNSLTHQKDNFSISEMLETIKEVKAQTNSLKGEKKEVKKVKAKEVIAEVKEDTIN